MPRRSPSSRACVDAAVSAHAIAPQPAGRRQFERAREPAVVGEQQQSLGVQVEPPDADQPRQVLRQRAEDGRAALRVGAGGDEAARLVEQEQPRALAPRQRLAVDADAVGGRDVERWRGDGLAVDRHAAGRDPRLGLAARRHARPRHHLGDALGGFRRRRRAHRLGPRQRGLQPLAAELAAAVAGLLVVALGHVMVRLIAKFTACVPDAVQREAVHREPGPSFLQAPGSRVSLRSPGTRGMHALVHGYRARRSPRRPRRGRGAGRLRDRARRHRDRPRRQPHRCATAIRPHMPSWWRSARLPLRSARSG